MQKVIKKFTEIDDPVLIDRKTVKRDSSKTPANNGNIIAQSLAFSKIISSEIDELKENAIKQSHTRNQIFSQELGKIYNEGYEKGLVDGIQRERDESMKSIDALLKEAKKKSKSAIRDLEIKVFELAVTIAEKIIRKSITADPSIAENIVSETMSHIIGSEMVILKVSAEDYTIINSKYNKWFTMAGSAGEFRIEIDKRLRTGDFVVETEGGIIDSIISDRIDVLVEELLKVSQ